MFTKQKIAIAAKYRYFKGRNNIERFESKGFPRIFLIDTPSHGNLGDHAIALAEYKFLSDYFPGYCIFEICEDDFNESILAIQKCISQNDIVVLSGGGNLGDIYMLDEKIRRKTIRKIRNNPIFIFPQSISFSNSIGGNLQSIISCVIYRLNKNLVVCAREMMSYNKAKKMFRGRKVLLAPDMALYLNENFFPDFTQKTLLTLILRSDLEKNLTDKQQEQIFEAIVKKSQMLDVNVKRMDTVVKRQIPIQQRSKELRTLFDRISQSGVIITDRLHGMILAAVSGTLCIALPNSNQKLREVYNCWLKKTGYIKFCENIEEVVFFIKEIGYSHLQQYEYKGLKQEFDTFSQEIKKICRQK